jgi:hypothetical protein
VGPNLDGEGRWKLGFNGEMRDGNGHPTITLAVHNRSGRVEVPLYVNGAGDDMTLCFNLSDPDSYDCYEFTAIGRDDDHSEDVDWGGRPTSRWLGICM